MIDGFLNQARLFISSRADVGVWAPGTGPKLIDAITGPDYTKLHRLAGKLQNWKVVKETWDLGERKADRPPLMNPVDGFVFVFVPRCRNTSEKIHSDPEEGPGGKLCLQDRCKGCLLRIFPVIFRDLTSRYSLWKERKWTCSVCAHRLV